MYEDRVKKAVDLFMSGYGCCQSVVAAYADLYGLTEQQALAIGAGFGGGVGRMRMMCGAVSGLVILAGLNDGQTLPDDRQGKSHCYQVVQTLVNNFKTENGSIICAELLGLKNTKETTHIPSERNAQYYATRPCAAKVECAARIFKNYLERNKKDF